MVDIIWVFHEIHAAKYMREEFIRSCVHRTAAGGPCNTEKLELTDNLYNYILAHTPELKVRPGLQWDSKAMAWSLQLPVNDVGHRCLKWSLQPDAGQCMDSGACSLPLSAYHRSKPKASHLQVLTDLREATAEQHAGRERNQVAPEQGRFLAWLVETLGVRQAIEIGVFTGYSSLAVAMVGTTTLFRSTVLRHNSAAHQYETMHSSSCSVGGANSLMRRTA